MLRFTKTVARKLAFVLLLSCLPLYGFTEIHGQAATSSYVTGIVKNSSLSVYSKASTSSTVLKKYTQGTLLKYKVYNSSWYQSAVYVNGKSFTCYIRVSDVETAVSTQKSLTGRTNSTTNVYSRASTSSSVLKSYAGGSVLKYKTFTSGWYQSTVYIKGKAVTCYIRKTNVENAASPQVSLTGVALNGSIKVYSKPTIYSAPIKSYSKGAVLKYKTFTSGWYQSTVYVNGVPKTAYIRKSDVEVKYYVKTSTLNVRAGSNTDSAVITAVKAGTALNVSGASGNWGKVTTSSGVSGWAYLPYLSRTAPTNGVRGQTIVIDPGHGGKDPGAKAVEKKLNLETALKLEAMLESKGANVIMTRSNDEYLTLSERVDVAEQYKPDAFISIHYNSSTSTSADGIDTFYYASNVNERELAECIQEELIKQTGLDDRGVQIGNFHVIRENKYPAILVELGFLSNPTELKIVSTSSYQTKAASAITKGLENYFNR
ncbi:N-acetylmuramoyl-L-alanine amidase [Peribacillus sp. SCS-155]|uniref:N-acetylmuramoyl-L-alanine amidase n=1 Tax=Peribacillus sedimenti TaxID=3115297 RepID=UPI0039068153